MKSKIKVAVVSIVLMIALLFQPAGSSEVNAASKPNLKRVALVASTTISVSWSKVYGAKKYEIYCSEDNSKYEKVKETKKTNYSFKDLDLGTKYSYKVRAVLKSKKSVFSNARNVTTLDWAYLLDVAKPYNNPDNYYETKFTVAGDSYGRGFNTSGNGTELYFNLKGKYSKISFVCGSTSDYADYEEEIEIYADGNKVSDTIIMKGLAMAKSYTVNINYCNQLRIVLPYRSGMGNIKVYK